MGSKLISVIVPCYNQAHFLSETLDSMVNQTYSNWECIIVNDGSTDNTEEVALSYVERDKRFIYYRQENRGLSSARNAGLNMAKGSFIQFLDSDDILLQSKLEKQINIMVDNSYDICVCKYKLFSKDKNRPFSTEISVKDYNFSLDGFLYSWNVDFVFPPVCYFVRKDFLKEKEIFFNKKLKAWEDWFFLLQMTLNKANFFVINEELALYRRHVNNMTNNIDFMSENLIKATFAVHEILPEDIKEDYVRKINIFLLHTLKDLIGVKQMQLKINSLEYKVGVYLLKPYRQLSKFCNKIIRKTRKVCQKFM